jgi:hypothetical protein
MTSLKTKQAALAIACVGLVVVILGCFAAQMYQLKNFSYTYQDQPCKVTVHSGIVSFKAITIDQYCMLAFPPTDGTAITSAASVNATRNQIFNYISDNPGVQFRAICAGLCLPVGLVQYYVAGLVKSGLVSFVRDGRYKRFFVAKRYSTRQMLAICMLRHKTARRIVEVLLCKKHLSHGRLAYEVSVTSQGLTWQMRALKNTPFIACTNVGLKTIYCLDEASAPLLQECLRGL